MRILHTADWHLGQRLHERSRIEEQKQFLNWLLETIQKTGVSLLLVSGDIFDTALPSAEATDLYYQFLYELFTQTDATAIITAGNHDSPQHLEAPQEFLKMGRIYVVGLVSEPEACVFTFPPEKPSVAIAAVPYLSENKLSHISFETEPERTERYRERLKAFYRKCVAHMPVRLPKILMGHLFVHGGKVGDSERNIQIGGASAIRVSDFPDGVDYVALGHLHQPHAISGANYPIQYSGSPLPLRFNEAGYRKKVYLLDIPTVCNMAQPTLASGVLQHDSQQTHGEVLLTEIEIPVFKELCTVTGRVNELLTMAMSPEWHGKYIQVQLKLDRPEVGMSDKIRNAFYQRGGEVLSVEVELPAPAQGPEIQVEDMKRPQDIFEQFHTAKFGKAPDAPLAQTFGELMRLVENLRN